MLYEKSARVKGIIEKSNSVVLDAIEKVHWIIHRKIAKCHLTTDKKVISCLSLFQDGEADIVADR